jgi:hypothetical protein
VRYSLAILAASCGLVLSGCSGAPVMRSSLASSDPAAGAAISGKVHGGQSPISGAHVYLYAANNTGYGGPGIAASSSNASISLLNSSVLTQTPAGGYDGTNYYVTTDANGNFTITGDYTCPSSSSVTYVYAVGGNPGLAPGTNNTAATLIAPVQACSTTNFVFVNEVSTIAAAYAMAGFTSDPTHMSSSNTALAAKGIGNAENGISNLYTETTGVALATTPAGNGTVPQSEINTLANILAACVNSTGPSSTGCAGLFADAMNGSTAPTDTATAAINIAHNPGANASSLYTLSTANAPFQPALTAAPNDFTVVIDYTGGGLTSPGALAVDGEGNVWVTNNFVQISEFSPNGTPLSGSSGFRGGGLSYPYAIAIDGSGNVWLGNYSNSSGAGTSISEFNSSGTALSPSTGYTGGGLHTPDGIAIDGSGHVWVANDTNNSVSEFDSNGTAVSPSTGYTGGGLSSPSGIAINGAGNAWVANQSSLHDISEFSSTGTPISGSSGYTGGGLSYNYAVAIDSSGNVWVSNNDSGAASRISEFNSSGTALSCSKCFTGGGLNVPEGIAIDGAGNVWAANEGAGTGNSISELSSSGTAISPSTGYQGGGITDPANLAIDGSGNVWVQSSGLYISEFVGAATPVITPIVAGLPATPTSNGTSNLGTRP